MKFDAVKNSLITEAKRAGLEEYEVFYMESSGISAQTLKDEISSFSSAVNGGVCFRCLSGGKIGSASTELLEEEEMRALVARAIANAGMLESDDEVEIFEGSDHYEKPETSDYRALSAAEIKEIALDLQKETYAQSGLVTDGTESCAFCESFSVELLNSKGLYLRNTAGVSCAYVSVAVRRGEEAQDAFDFAPSLKPEDLSTLPGRVVEEAISKLSAQEVDSGKYDVIISGRQMRALLSAYSSVFSAKSAQLGLSLLRGKEGEKIAADTVTLIDDPMRHGAPVQTPFDGEGVATYRKPVIEGGVLKTLLYDLATAKKAGRTSTGNGQRASYSDAVTIRPYNFYLAPGTLGEGALFARLKDGIYITELKGLHAGADAVTGDFSIDSEGFMVRDGRICEAVRSFTVAGNFFDLLKKIEAVGDRVYFGIPAGFTVYGSPDVLLQKMSIAGK